MKTASEIARELIDHTSSQHWDSLAEANSYAVKQLTKALTAYSDSKLEEAAVLVETHDEVVELGRNKRHLEKKTTEHLIGNTYAEAIRKMKSTPAPGGASK